MSKFSMQRIYGNKCFVLSGIEITARASPLVRAFESPLWRDVNNVSLNSPDFSFNN